MGLRFQRRVRLFPGVRINLSRSGVSTSIGTRGAWLTFGLRGRRRATVGLPGAGLSYTASGQAQGREHAAQSAGAAAPRPMVGPALVVALVLVAVLTAILVRFTH